MGEIFDFFGPADILILAFYLFCKKQKLSVAKCSLVLTLLSMLIGIIFTLMMHDGANQYDDLFNDFRQHIALLPVAITISINIIVWLKLALFFVIETLIMFIVEYKKDKTK